MATTIDIRDQATAALHELKANLRPEAVNPRIGTEVVKLFQSHFIALPTNRQGFPSTGFWADAARATNFFIWPDGVLVSVNKQGVRQRLQGGPIKPGPGKKYLTIPRHADAYGHRARELSNLEFSVVPGYGPALIAQRAVATMIEKATRGKKAWKAVADQVGVVVMYQLVRSVYQPPNPNVIPSEDQITAAARRGILSFAA